MGVFYVTREGFKAAAGFKGIGTDAAIDRLLESASRQIDSLLRRHFYPVVATKAYEWPAPFQNTSLRLYLADDLLDVTSILSGGAPMTSYVPQPVNDGPPYSRIEVNLASDDSFEQDAVRQLSIIIEGIWGYSWDMAVVGALVDTIDNVQTDLIVPDASRVGIGDLIFIGTEAMLVTDKLMLVNTSLLDGAVTANAADTLITVDAGTDFNVGEVVLVGAERMLISAIAANDLVVKRAYDGTVLAAHTDDDPTYVERTLTVVRAACGTTPDAHTAADPITRNVPPGLISDWCLAEAVSRFYQEESGYARNIGSGDAAIEVTGKALKDIRAQCMDAYYRGRGPRAI